MTGRPRARNRLLEALTDADYKLFGDHLQAEEVAHGRVLYEAEDTVDTVWFPESGMASLMSPMLNGDMIETAIVGCEGAIGFIEACGSGITFSRVVIQAPGRFWRVPAGAYREAYGRCETLRLLIHDHFELMLAEARQVIACRNLHPVDERLAWWLLEAQDRMGEDKLPLTQEFLSVMLGVQRTTVTDHASQLQDQGLIRYRRGMIEVVDRKGLEARACECHATTEHFRKLIEEQEARKGLRRPPAAAA
jgi:CRP-like cAMP-binding protein